MEVFTTFLIAMLMLLGAVFIILTIFAYMARDDDYRQAVILNVMAADALIIVIAALALFVVRL